MPRTWPERLGGVSAGHVHTRPRYLASCPVLTAVSKSHHVRQELTTNSESLLSVTRGREQVPMSLPASCMKCSKVQGETRVSSRCAQGHAKGAGGGMPAPWSGRVGGESRRPYGPAVTSGHRQESDMWCPSHCFSTTWD